MKKIATIAAAILFSLPVMAESKKAAISKNQVVANLDVTSSKAVWFGKKVTGTHTGKVSFKNGKFEYQNNKLVGGEVVVDLTSISNEDLKDPEYNQKLVGHLKSEDFFNVEKFPEATFKFNSVSEIMNFVPGQPNIELKGTLTIRGISKPYTTKVILTPNATGFEAKGRIQIERTQFGLKYNSKKFFDVKALGDKLIDDLFEVDLDLIAKK